MTIILLCPPVIIDISRVAVIMTRMRLFKSDQTRRKKFICEGLGLEWAEGQSYGVILQGVEHKARLDLGDVVAVIRSILSRL